MAKDILGLSEAITYYLDAMGIRDEADMHSIVSRWEELMGKPIAAHTEKVWFSEGTLFIQVNTPVWKNELSMAKLKIRSMINGILEREVIKEVRVL
ncbi:MAG: DUF721 domain-containing protein [Bacteroidia bacterium]|nr:DUF721 domain-containing protein [Bacteroidia bacterium]